MKYEYDREKGIFWVRPEGTKEVKALQNLLEPAEETLEKKPVEGGDLALLIRLRDIQAA